MSKTQASNSNKAERRIEMKCDYRRYKIGEIIEVQERDYIGGDDPLHRSATHVNNWKVVEDYPLFVVCERQTRNSMFYPNEKIRTTFSKWDLEHGVVQCV